MCIRDSVGAGGIGLILNEKISWREFHKVGTILLLLFLSVCAIESANRYFTGLIQSGRISELFSSGSRTMGRRNFRTGSLLITGFALLFLCCLMTQNPPDLSRTSYGCLLYTSHPEAPMTETNSPSRTSNER